ncbi:hypothetical protein RM69_09200 [Mesotoga sp. SC_NapDC3]|uniref:hypothetical protein n=1 Tax=Mesotoga sp. TaxID=2053577 RepID=UPI000CB56AEB|nr:hypothetical protein [Mesotoga sp.]PNQ03909.1 hypothetical protein RM69_09200 [Mesotoga sp. SC_NapDC3]
MEVFKSFLEMLEKQGYCLHFGEEKQQVFACIHHENWDTLVVIRVYDDGEAVSLCNFVVDTKDQITYELLETEYERSTNSPNPRSEEYEEYIAYNL